MPECKTCQANKQQKPVFKRDISTARGTRLIRHFVVAFAAVIIALSVAIAVIIVSINYRWSETVQKMNDRWAEAVEKTNEKWAEYLGECDVYDISYDQDGSGVNVIGSSNEVNNNVAAVESQGDS